MKFNLSKAAFLALGFLLISYKSVFSAETSLYFDKNNISVKQGEQKEIDIFVDPAGVNLTGIDLILKYDTNYIKVVDIKDREAFSFQPKEIIDNASGVAKAAFSNNRGIYLNQKKVFATVVIEGVGVHENTSLNFDHTLGKTTDTNVVSESGTDVLASAANLKIVVTSSSNSSNNSSNSQTPTLTAATATSDADTPVLGETVDDQGDGEELMATTNIESKEDKSQKEQDYTKSVLGTSDGKGGSSMYLKVFLVLILFISGGLTGALSYRLATTDVRENSKIN